jgi:hypothetical protein
MPSNANELMPLSDLSDPSDLSDQQDEKDETATPPVGNIANLLFAAPDEGSISCQLQDNFSHLPTCRTRGRRLSRLIVMAKMMARTLALASSG